MIVFEPELPCGAVMPPLLLSEKSRIGSTVTVSMMEIVELAIRVEEIVPERVEEVTVEVER